MKTWKICLFIRTARVKTHLQVKCVVQSKWWIQFTHCYSLLTICISSIFNSSLISKQTLWQVFFSQLQVPQSLTVHVNICIRMPRRCIIIGQYTIHINTCWRFWNSCICCLVRSIIFITVWYTVILWKHSYINVNVYTEQINYGVT